MKIEIGYEELLDIVNALKARADVIERMPARSNPRSASTGSARPRIIAHSPIGCSPKPAQR
jgi:hypothetical protein